MTATQNHTLDRCYKCYVEMLDFKIDLYILWLFLGSASILVSPLKMISSCLSECLMAFPQLTLRFLDSPDFETFLDFRTGHMSGRALV